MATFNEMHTPTFRKYVTEQDIVMPNWLKTSQTFWLHLTVFDLEKQPKNLNFQSCFTYDRSFDGYFQWNACNCFQKICSWTRHNDATLIKIISNFFVALQSFCSIREPKNLSFQNFLTSNRPFDGYLQWNACTNFQKKINFNQTAAF